MCPGRKAGAIDDQLIDIFTGEQNSPEYRKLHRSAKVPALVVDGKPIAENATIQMRNS